MMRFTTDYYPIRLIQAALPTRETIPEGYGKMDLALVPEIRRLYKQGEDEEAIAQQLDISRTSVYFALKDVDWGPSMRKPIDPATDIDWGPPKPVFPGAEPAKAPYAPRTDPAKTPYVRLLSDKDVVKMRKLFRKGVTAKELAVMFKVSVALVHNALSGRDYPHVPDPIVRLPGADFEARLVKKLRDRYRAGDSVETLQRKFKLSRATIIKALTWEWPDVTDPVTL